MRPRDRPGGAAYKGLEGQHQGQQLPTDRGWRVAGDGEEILTSEAGVVLGHAAHGRFQARLYGAWSNLAWWKLSLPLAAGLQQDNF